MSENIIIEVDLAIHPYQGIIGCFQDKWTGWLEPGFIYYLPRDSPITYDIYPSDFILCKKEPIYECDMGHVLMPIKKLRFEEIIELISKEPKIKIFEWDKISEKKSVFNLIKNILVSLTRLEQKNTLTSTQVKKLAQDLEELFKIPTIPFLFPEMKTKSLNIIADRLGKDFFLRIIKLLIKYQYKIHSESQTSNRYYNLRESQKAGVLTRNEFLSLLFPELRLANRQFTLDIGMKEVIERILANENTEQEKYDELKLEIISKLETYVNNVGTEQFNVEWFKSLNFDDLKKRVLDIRIKEVSSALILFQIKTENGQEKKQYNIRNLRRTYMGRRLLESLKIPSSIEWIDDSMYNLIEAALRKFKITLTPEKQR